VKFGDELAAPALPYDEYVYDRLPTKRWTLISFFFIFQQIDRHFNQPRLAAGGPQRYGVVVCNKIVLKISQEIITD